MYFFSCLKRLCIVSIYKHTYILPSQRNRPFFLLNKNKFLLFVTSCQAPFYHKLPGVGGKARTIFHIQPQFQLQRQLVTQLSQLMRRRVYLIRSRKVVWSPQLPYLSIAIFDVGVLYVTILCRLCA
jgi:hypothetical protein